MESKKKLLQVMFVGVLTVLIFLNSVSAVEVDLNYSSANKVQIQQLKYEPYPVNPGDYFEVWFAIQGIGSSSSQSWVFTLLPEYPFSLDSNENAVWEFGDVNSPSVVINYNVRVDEDAIDGTYDLTLQYEYNNQVYTKTFEIEVEDSRTDFDAVIQDTSDDEVSIAIANVGKYTANSVVVKIPEQDDFQATDTSGQMVGNLDAGDYTIVSFSISAVMQRSMPTESDEDSMPDFSESSQSDETTLQFDIYYTDELGERRVVNMELPLSMSSGNMTSMTFGNGNFPGGNQTSFFSSWYVRGAIIFIILVIGFFVYKKYPRQTKKVYAESKNKVKSLFGKKKENNSGEIPDWIKNHKGKKK